jgi:hypothetical protein
MGSAFAWVTESVMASPGVVLRAVVTIGRIAAEGKI